MKAHSCFIIIQHCILCVSTCSEVPDADDWVLWSHIVFTELYVISQIGTQLELILQSATLIFHPSLMILFSGSPSLFPLGSFLFGSSLAGGFWDEQCLYAHSGGVQPSPPGQRHPVLTPVHSGSHHLCSRCERASRLPRQPQDDPLWGGCARRDNSYGVCCPRSRSLHPPDCQV